MQVKKQQLEPDMEQQTGSKYGKEYVKAAFCHPAYLTYMQSSVQFIHSVVPTLCDPMNCSKPGLPVHHQLPEFTQTHVCRVGDAIEPSHPLLSPSPPAPANYFFHTFSNFYFWKKHSEKCCTQYAICRLPACPQFLPASESFPMSQLFA